MGVFYRSGFHEVDEERGGLLQVPPLPGGQAGAQAPFAPLDMIVAHRLSQAVAERGGLVAS